MAASDNKIVLTPVPHGHFIEGLLDASSTPKPGQMVTMKNVAPVGNDYTFELFNGAADGDRSEIIVVIEDSMQGKTVADAYAASSRFFGYIPLPGDELNVLFNNVAGTADDVAIGDKLIVDDGTGKVNVTTGSPEREPFIALEAITDPTADQLLHVRYTGV